MKVFIGTPQEYMIDGYHLQTLNTAKEVIKKDWDMLFLYDGNEGVGKSVKAMQDAYYCDPTLTVERITFTPKEFKEQIMKAKKYQAIIYDEAYTGLSSRATMSMINRTLITMLAEIRQKNLFVFVVMPTFFDIDKYVALWRSRGLIHVYTGNKFKRGFFAFFNVDKKKSLYIQGKKWYSYGKPRANYIGRFTNHYTVDEKEYKKKKRDSLLLREKETAEKELKREVQDQMFANLMTLPANIQEKLTNRMKAQILGVTERYFYIKLKNWQEKGEL